MIYKIIPIAIKDFKQIKRDPLTLGILIVIPAFMLIMFGYALNFDVKNIKIAFFDIDKTTKSREFMTEFINSGYFEFVKNASNLKEIDELLQKGEVTIAIIIPESFTKKIIKGETAKVQILIDGTNSNTASIVVGYVNAIISSYSKKLLVEQIKKLGKNFNEVIEYKPRIYFNPELKSVKFLILGLISLILLLTCVISTSLSIVREKERNTIEQILVSPIRIGELIIGKLINYIVIAICSTVLIFFTGYFLFNIEIKGNYFMLLTVILIYLILSLSIGVLISSISNSQQTAFMLSTIITILPTFILSGFVFPIRNMPKIIQLITYIVPTRYFIAILKSIVLKGANFSSYSSDFISMFILMSIFLLLSFIRTKKIKM